VKSPTNDYFASGSIQQAPGALLTVNSQARVTYFQHPSLRSVAHTFRRDRGDLYSLSTALSPRSL